MALKALVLERLEELRQETNQFAHYKYDTIRHIINQDWKSLHDVELLDLFECVIQKYYLVV